MLLILIIKVISIIKIKLILLTLMFKFIDVINVKLLISARPEQIILLHPVITPKEISLLKVSTYTISGKTLLADYNLVNAMTF